MPIICSLKCLHHQLPSLWRAGLSRPSFGLGIHLGPSQVPSVTPAPLQSHWLPPAVLDPRSSQFCSPRCPPQMQRCWLSLHPPPPGFISPSSLILPTHTLPVRPSEMLPKRVTSRRVKLALVPAIPDLPQGSNAPLSLPVPGPPALLRQARLAAAELHSRALRPHSGLRRRLPLKRP